MDRVDDRHVSQQRLREQASHVAGIRIIKDIKQVSRNITRLSLYSSFHMLLLFMCVCVTFLYDILYSGDVYKIFSDKIHF